MVVDGDGWEVQEGSAGCCNDELSERPEDLEGRSREGGVTQSRKGY